MSFPRLLMVFALAYWAGAELAYATPGNFAGFWLPAGIYLAVLVRTPLRRWWAVCLAAGAANLLADVAVHRHLWLFGLGYLLVNVGAPLVGAALLVRLCRPALSFARLPHVLRWGLVITFISTPLGALGGAALLTARRGGDYWQEWYLWWIGDLLGIVVAMPLTLGLLDWRAWPRPARAREAAALLLSVSVATWLLFRQPDTAALPPGLLYLFLMWAALRLGAAGVAATALPMLVISLWLTVARGTGPYSYLSTEQGRVQIVQLFIALGAFLFYILAAVMAERRAAESELRAGNVRLDEEVKARTAELRRAAEFHAAAMDRLGEGLYTVDAQGLVTYMNPAAEELFGWTFAELRGKRMHDMTHHHYRDGREFPIEECVGFQVKTTGKPLTNFEDVFIRKDGTFFDVSYSIAPLRDAGGTINGLVIVFSDITKRKEAEEQLRVSEERYRRLLRQSPAGVVQADAQGRMVFVNERWCEMLGYSEAELLQMNVIDVTHPTSVTATLEAVGRLAQGGADFQIEKNYRRKDGSMMRANSNVAALRDAAGNYQGLVAVVLDITARLEAEERLRESEEKFRTFISAISDIVYEMSADWREMRHLNGREFIVTTSSPRNDWTDEYIPAAEKERVWATIRHAIATKSRFELEHQVIRLDGSTGWTFSRAIPLLDERGEISKWFGAASDITARKEAEEKLRASEELLSSTFAGIEGAITISEVIDGGGEFRFLAANRACIEYTGIPLEKWRGARPQDLLPPADAAAICRRYREAVRKGSSLEYEELLNFPAREIQALTTVTPLRDANGVITRVVATSIDITERKRAEEQLRESEERYRAVVKAAAAIEWIAAPGGDFVTPQASWEEFTGQTFADYSGDNWASTLHPDDRERTLRAWRKAVTEKSRYEMENRMRWRDGEYRWMQVRAIPIFDEAGEIREWIGTNTDITTRKEAEEKLRESRARLAATQANAPIGIVETALDGSYLYVNDEFCRLTGYARNELLKLKFSEITFAEDLPRNRELFGQLAAGEIPSFRLEKRFVRKDGSLIWADVNRTLVKDATGNPLYVIGAINDISERKRAEEQLRESETFVRATLNSLVSSVSILDRDGVILDVNDAWTQFAEENGAKMPRHGISFNYLEVVRQAIAAGAADVKPILTGIEAVLNGNNPKFEYEYSCHSPDEQRWFIVSVSPLARQQGGAVVSHINITERKRAEAATARLAAIVTSSSDAILSITLTGVVTSWNAGAERMFGYTADEIIGQSIRRLIPPERQTEEDDILARLRNGENIEHHETVRMAKDGRRIDVSLTISPIKDGAGTIIGASKIIRDIGERKQLEQKIREQFDELENIYRTAPIGLALIDREFRFARINERLAEINGLPTEKHLGRSLREIVPDIADQAEAVFRQVFATGEPILHTELEGETSAQPGVKRSWDESWYPIKTRRAKPSVSASSSKKPPRAGRPKLSVNSCWRRSRNCAPKPKRPHALRMSFSRSSRTNCAIRSTPSSAMRGSSAVSRRRPIRSDSSPGSLSAARSCSSNSSKTCSTRPAS